MINKSNRRFLKFSFNRYNTNPSYDSLFKNSWQWATDKKQVDSRAI